MYTQYLCVHKCVMCDTWAWTANAQKQLSHDTLADWQEVQVAALFVCFTVSKVISLLPLRKFADVLQLAGWETAPVLCFQPSHLSQWRFRQLSSQSSGSTRTYPNLPHSPPPSPSPTQSWEKPFSAHVRLVHLFIFNNITWLMLAAAAEIVM